MTAKGKNIDSSFIARAGAGAKPHVFQRGAGALGAKTGRPVAVVICFLLFAVQLNAPYFLPADPSADANDPVSVIARVIISPELSGLEDIPVYQESVQRTPFEESATGAFAVAGPSPVISSSIVSSPRGPPTV